MSCEIAKIAASYIAIQLSEHLALRCPSWPPVDAATTGINNHSSADVDTTVARIRPTVVPPSNDVANLRDSILYNAQIGQLLRVPYISKIVCDRRLTVGQRVASAGCAVFYRA
jgi:hypothetical protein